MKTTMAAPNIGPVVIFFGLLGAGLADLSLPTSLIGSVKRVTVTEIGSNSLFGTLADEMNAPALATAGA